MPEIFRRHAFVWLAKEAGADISGGREMETLRDWIAWERPLIVRRPCLSPDGREVAVGLALPGRRRFAWSAPVRHVARVEPPPLWKGDAPVFRDLGLRLFGSHAWQHLTGLPYVTESSDIDLLADIDSTDAWHAFRRSMDAATFPDSPRIDLEVVLRGDASFQWREFAAPGGDLLVKSNRDVWLERKDRVEALLS